MGTARTRASNKWAANNYDRIQVQVKKGEKEKIIGHAKEQGESTNGFITRAINETMTRDKDKEP